MDYPIVVIGPFQGVYHLAYEVDGGAKYLSINPFVSKDLAESAAYLMDSARARSLEADKA